LVKKLGFSHLVALKQQEVFMLKIFSTQLTGVFKKIIEEEEFSLEDGARLLAQAPVGNGNIYIFGTKEMKAVEYEAIEGSEPLKGAKILVKSEIEQLTDSDRILFISRLAEDEEIMELASILQEKGIPFVSIATGIGEMADVHIDLKLTKGLLPDEEGNRFGYPASMAALFAYYGLKFSIDEMLSEYE
jgi:hypothetical protein